MSEARGRVAALDLGSRRIGVACSDSRRTLASPWGVVQRSGDPARDRQEVVAVISEIEAATVVVGLPLSLSGATGPAAQAALREVEALRAARRSGTTTPPDITVGPPVEGGSSGPTWSPRSGCGSARRGRSTA